MQSSAISEALGNVGTASGLDNTFPGEDAAQPKHRVEQEDDVEAYMAFQEEKEELEYADRTSKAAAAAALSTGTQPASVSPPPLRKHRPPKDVVRNYTRKLTFRMSRRLGSSARVPSVPSLSRVAKESLTRELMSNEMDNFGLMMKLRERMEAVGMEIPAVEVRFRNLCSSREVLVGTRSLPTLSNVGRSLLEALASPFLKLAGISKAKKRTLTMLDNVSGVLKPGRLMIMLGPPGAGKSTLLRLLSGQLKGDNVQWSGEVTYNGVHMKDFCVERTAAYIDQIDKHLAEMTVRETLAFSARMMGQGYGQDPILAHLQTREKEKGVIPDPQVAALAEQVDAGRRGENIMVYMISQLLGLDICIDTLVGNDLVKGISGGQRKRVTTGELAVGRHPVLLMDEISTGLDSASTFLIIKALKNLCSFLKVNIIIALLQPAPETYELFDDVFLMGDKKLLYHGPREEVLPFLRSTGLSCPHSKAHADFLQEVISKGDQPAFWARPASEGGRYVPAEEIAAAFRESQQGKARAVELEEPQSPTELAMKKLERKQYALGTFSMLGAIFLREVLLVRRNKVYLIAKALQTIITGFIISTVFAQWPKDSMNDANYYMSVSFFSLLQMMIGGFSEVPMFIQRLPIFYKQRNYHFFPAWAYCLGSALVRVPDGCLMATLWSIMVYWTVGFTASAGQFFLFVFIMCSMSVFSVALFRTIAALTREEPAAKALGAMMLVLSVNTCGFTIARTSIPPWWIWMYWLSPLSYAVRGMMVNELNSQDWSKQVLVHGNQTEDLGEFTLQARGFQPETWWAWVAVAVLLGSAVVLTFIQAFLLTHLDEHKGSETVPDEEEHHASNGTPGTNGHVSLTIPAAASKAENGSSSGHRSSGQAQHSGTGGSGTAGSGDHKQHADHFSVVSSMWESSNGTALSHAAGAGNEKHLHHQDCSRGLPVMDIELSAAAEDGGEAAAVAVAAASGGPHQSRPSHQKQLEGSSFKVSFLQFTPITVAFKSIWYHVPKPKGKKGEELTLLRGVDGCFRPGVLTALMGASGAGKTTLMDVLAGRKTEGRIEGEIIVNGKPKNQKTFTRVMGYVEQFDVHTQQATVVEALLFSARLRLPPYMEDAAVQRFVHEVMDLVELAPLSNMLIGLPGLNGLSVEQRKRLTIAVELVANPSVVYMDEPTSGLDARAASIVMRSVRNTVNTGRTVVCTIHQPNLTIFQAFDELLLLKPGGETIFSGPLGPDQTNLINHFESVPGVAKFLPGHNPANWMLDITAPGAEHALGRDFATIYAESKLNEQNKAQVEEACKPPPPLHHHHHADGEDAASSSGSSLSSMEADLERPFAATTWKQFKLLFQRNTTTYWRSPNYNLTRLVVTVVIGLVFGSLYWGVGADRTTVVAVLNIMGSLYSAVIFVGVSNLMMVMSVIFHERVVYYREKAAGIYSPLPYAFAQGLVEQPYILVQTVMYANIVYWMVGFQADAAKFFWFMLFLYLNFCTQTFFGIMAVNVTPSVQLGTIVVGAFFTIWNLLCGFLIAGPDIPPWWIWMYYSNPISYILWGLVASQLGDVTDEYINTATPGADRNLVTVAQYVDDVYGYSHSMLGWLVLILIGFLVFFRLIAVYALFRMNFQKR